MDVPKSTANGTGLGWYIWRGLEMLRCPNGHVATLSHSIDESGRVMPSAVCPFAGCTFHEFIRLDGYDGPSRGKLSGPDMAERADAADQENEPHAR